MKAAVLHAPNQPMTIEDVVLEKPKRREVLVRAARTTAIVMFLCAGAQVASYMITLADLPGVLSYRDLDDVQAMLLAAQSRQKAVVIGGGLLGHNPLVYLALLLVPCVWWLLYRTRAGLRLALGLAYAAAGVLHLAVPAPFLGITPGWVPMPETRMIPLRGAAEGLISTSSPANSGASRATRL